MEDLKRDDAITVTWYRDIAETWRCPNCGRQVIVRQGYGFAPDGENTYEYTDYRRDRGNFICCRCGSTLGEVKKGWPENVNDLSRRQTMSRWRGSIYLNEKGIPQL